MQSRSGISYFLSLLVKLTCFVALTTSDLRLGGCRNIQGPVKGPFPSSLLPPILDPCLEYMHRTILQHQLSNLTDEEDAFEDAEVGAEFGGAVVAPDC